MKQPKATIFNALAFYPAYGIMFLLSLLPLRILYIISDMLYVLLFHITGYRKKVVYNNLTNAFPEKTPWERQQIAKKFYKHFSDVLVEMIKMVSINEKQLTRRIKFKNPEVLNDLYDEGKSVIAVIAHYGNWEWLVASCKEYKHRLLAIYKPLHNKYFDDFFIRLRNKFGMELVPMHRTLHTMINYQNKNIPIVTSFIADQSTIKEKTQYWINFLNQETGVYLGVEKIARRLGHAVVFLIMHKTSRGHYTIEFKKLVDNPAEEKTYAITDKHVAALEQEIKKQPAYWLWTHKRWKVKRDQ